MSCCQYSCITTALPCSSRASALAPVLMQFSARRACEERGYEYFLPASVLGLQCDGGSEDQGKIRWGWIGTMENQWGVEREQ